MGLMDGLIGVTRKGSVDRLIGLRDGRIGVTRKGSVDRLIGLMEGLIGVTRKGSVDRLIGLMDGLIGFDLGFGGWIGSPSGRGTLEREDETRWNSGHETAEWACYRDVEGLW